MPQITIAEGNKMIKKYKEMRMTILRDAEPDILTLSETFSRQEILELLEQEDCEKFRCYLGMEDDLSIRVILVAVDADNQDILGTVVDKGVRDPVNAPPASALNS